MTKILPKMTIQEAATLWASPQRAHLGKWTRVVNNGGYENPIHFPPLINPVPGGPALVEIWNTEEKGSDVNVATYLIHDAWRDLFDVAVVLSQDTDLNESAWAILARA